MGRSQQKSGGRSFHHCLHDSGSKFLPYESRLGSQEKEGMMPTYPNISLLCNKGLHCSVFSRLALSIETEIVFIRKTDFAFKIIWNTLLNWWFRQYWGKYPTPSTCAFCRDDLITLTWIMGKSAPSLAFGGKVKVRPWNNHMVKEAWKSCFEQGFSTLAARENHLRSFEDNVTSRPHPQRLWSGESEARLRHLYLQRPPQGLLLCKRVSPSDRCSPKPRAVLRLCSAPYSSAGSFDQYKWLKCTQRPCSWGPVPQCGK